MQFFLGFAGYTAKAPFDASIMVHLRKRFSDENLRRINELVGAYQERSPLVVLV